MARIHLQSMVENLGANALPANWSDFDLTTFSHISSLWGFQQEALQNALAALWKYYSEPALGDEERKRSFMQWYEDNELQDDLRIRLDRSTAAKRDVANLLERYYTPDENDSISYQNFINRMSFWMATGSGKTLVLVKLIEILHTLKMRDEIPAHDILVLTYREDLLEQLKDHVNEFNASGNFFIRLHELRDYPEIKRQPASFYQQEEIRVFYYRSDILSDEQKEKTIDFRSYDNDGKWYVLLDEAHKGDKEDAKSQQIFSIMTRNGFLFNFSATFTDPRDITTTVYNYNLSEYIAKGHGKHITILSQNVTEFRRDGDYSDFEKQKIVLKALLMLAYTRKIEARIRSVRSDIYHRPLLMTLVNSVNTDDADLKMFFREIIKIGNGQVDDATWESAKEELLAELLTDLKFQYEPKYKINLDRQLFNELTAADLMSLVFNATGSGESEIITRASDRKELAIQLVTGNAPFALVRIGDVTDWLKKELSDFNINQRLSDDAFFTQLNEQNSDINILLGSRSFYEGWDSNRPNVIMYINIGVSDEAKKFILQSVGRGVRIEPFKSKRRRLNFLEGANELTKDEVEIFHQIKKEVQPLETVYIFGTNRQALDLVMSELDRAGKQAGETEISLAVNHEMVDGKLLLVPIYHVSDVLLSKKDGQAKFSLEKDDLAMLERYMDYMDDDRVFYATHGTTPKQIVALRDALKNKEESFRDDGERKFKNLPVLVNQSLMFFGIKSKDLSGFKELEDEIKHFRHIKVSVEAYPLLALEINKAITSGERIKELKRQYEAHQISLDELLIATQQTSAQDTFIYKNFLLEIKKVLNHYYIPVILSRSEQIDYIRNIIRVTSEFNFMKDLESYMQIPDNDFNKFRWWLFSKVDEHMDDITIPYYDSYNNKIFNFKPDFIFWLKKEDSYHILFVDPKGMSRTEYQRKVDGYRQLFEENGKLREFEYQGMKVFVHLALYTTDRNWSAEFYRKYWFDSIGGMIGKI